jgi:glutamine amidotransferase-like uncharacterized protein
MRKLLLSLLFSKLTFGATLEHRDIAVYRQDPIASTDCAQAVRDVLATKYSNVFIINHRACTAATLRDVDCVVFPGGEGDVDNFDHMLRDRGKIIRDYVAQGGRYLGICMGGYITSKLYFNILGDTSAEQYIKHPRSNVHIMSETTTTCRVGGIDHMVYFYDGPVFERDFDAHNILATYQDGSAAAIIKPYHQGRVLCIGPHFESQRNWYDVKRLRPYWHGGVHHQVLLQMVDKIFTTTLPMTHNTSNNK